MRYSAKNPFPWCLFWWWAALAIALTLVAWDAVVRGGSMAALSASYGVAVNAPTIDPTSPTGYALERRSLVLPTLATDARHWIMQTQRSMTRGEWRVRTVDYDNAPAGREVHWAAPFRWWLLTLAYADQALTGTPLPLAIERSVLWANPVLFALLLLAITPIAVRHFGAFAGGFLALGLVGALPFAINFYAGNADHHGLAQVCAVLTVLFLVCARTPGARANAWVIASGIAGGLGLWISAASIAPVLIGVGFGALVEARLKPPEEPSRWRRWGLAGGVTSLLAYAIEYAPGNLGWRLEVNHPLYALAWIGGGELLCRIANALGARRPRWSGREIGIWAVAALAIIAPLLVILAGGSRVFALRDPFLQTLHAHYIAEFQSLPTYVAAHGGEIATVGQWLPMGVVMAVAAWLWKRNGTPETRAALALPLGPALLTIVLTIGQIRWWGLAFGLVMVVAIQAFARLDRGPTATASLRITRMLGLLALLPGLVSTVGGIVRGGIATEDYVQHLAGRDVAHRLRLRTGSESLVVAATPNVTTSLIYHASARGLGTLYWENHHGLTTTAELFGAATAAEAWDVVSRTGTTHVVLLSWDDSERDYVRLGRGLSPEQPLPSDTFAAALREGRTPSWLRRLPHALPSHPALHESEVYVFEVAPGRSPAEVAVHNAVFALESGGSTDLEKLESALGAHPDSLAAAATLAGLQARRRNEPAFRESMAAVDRLLSQTATLALEDSVRVAMVLGIAGRTGDAAGVLRAALARADERALRRLTPGTLADLLVLNEAVGVTFATSLLADLASELTPPR